MFSFIITVLITILKRTPQLANTDWGINILKIAADIGSTTTSGNVGVVAGHIILPQITGLHTMILTLLFMSPMLYYLFHNPHPKLFVHAVSYKRYLYIIDIIMQYLFIFFCSFLTISSYIICIIIYIYTVCVCTNDIFHVWISCT